MAYEAFCVVKSGARKEELLRYLDNKRVLSSILYLNLLGSDNKEDDDDDVDNGLDPAEMGFASEKLAVKAKFKLGNMLEKDDLINILLIEKKEDDDEENCCEEHQFMLTPEFSRAEKITVSKRPCEGVAPEDPLLSNDSDTGDLSNLSFTAKLGRSNTEIEEFTSIYVSNMPPFWTEKSISVAFSGFGDISSSRLMIDDSGTSKCYGFVNFYKHEDALKACIVMNGKIYGGKKLIVSPQHKRETKPAKHIPGEKASVSAVSLSAIEQYSLGKRATSNTQASCSDYFSSSSSSRPDGRDGLTNVGKKKYEMSFTNVFIKNMPLSWNEFSLHKAFMTFGGITSSRVVVDDSGKSKCFGFVNFCNHESAVRACETMHGQVHSGKPLCVAPFQRREDRKIELKRKCELLAAEERLDSRGVGVNVLISNIDETVCRESLLSLFQQYRGILDYKFVPGTGQPSHAFLRFDERMTANKVVSDLNGYLGIDVFVAPYNVTETLRRKSS